MAYTWQRTFVGSHSLTRDGAEWDEIYNVYGYDWTSTSAPLVDLTTDRPDLRPGQPHGSVANSYVVGFDPVRLATSRMAQVTVRYRSEPNEQPDVSPLDRPAKVSLESETITIPTFRRIDGSLILNTAGDLIHGLTRRVNLRLFSFEKNVAAIPAWLLDYSDNAVNSDTVTIDGQDYAAGYLQLQKVRGTPYESETVNGTPVSFRVLTFTLAFNPLGWDEKVLNRGLRAVPEDGTPGTDPPVWITEESGDPTDEPQFLDDDGKRLPTPIDPDDVIEIDGVGVTSLPFNSVLPLA